MFVLTGSGWSHVHPMKEAKVAYEIGVKLIVQ
jgi:hypothetical protein